jgi:hypothetical protein
MGTPVNQRVQKRREALRAQGLRPVQLWLPDTRDPKFRAQMEREARLINEADAKDAWLQAFMDETWRETLADLDESEAKSQQTKSKE